MNIILKSFLITLAVTALVLLIVSLTLLPEFYGLIGIAIVFFAMIWIYVYLLLK